MNQRIQRAMRKKIQNIDTATMNTGGHVVHHQRGKDPVVRVQKATGDVPGDKVSGLAKASPFFKRLKETLTPASKTEEQKVVAEASTPVEPKEEVKVEKKVSKKDVTK